jgi:raffinose/stachyose/melibiose transport system permease protein
MINNNLSVKNRIINILVALFALLYLVPFYFLIVNSFKTYAEIITNTSALPKHFNFNNFIKAFKAMEYIRVFMNSFIITLISNLGLVVISSMAAYRLVRKKTWINQIIFLILVASMVIPFQTIMIPLVQVLKIVGFINKYHGIIVCYLGFGTAISIFLFHGFIKLIPFDIEEAALID